MFRGGFAVCLLALSLPLGEARSAGADSKEPAVWLRGGTVIDGTGAAGFEADVLLLDGRIEAVGEVRPPEGIEVETIDASGLIIAPGFIDLHTHSDDEIVVEPTWTNRNYQAQGVTTIVTGNCGGGPVDVAGYLEQIDEQGAGTNVIHLIPQGSLRRQVMGTATREPTADEREEMQRLVAEGMEAGAWGMSTGLIYIPSRYASTDELIELAKVVGEYGGLYASHIRNENTGVLEAIDEAIEIGRQAGVPVHISHLKAGGRDAWGLIVPSCRKIAEAREDGLAVSADQYPYIASSTSLGAMVIPDWARRDGTEAFRKIADDPEEGERLREAIRQGLKRRNGGESIRIARFEERPDWVGKDLVAIAEAEETPVVEIVVEIERHGGAGAISFMMNEEDVRFGMTRPFVATASDGSAHQPGGDDRPHPRAYGTFPRKVRYALEQEVISLEHAIRAGSGLPAAILGLPDRGVIRQGNVADVVVFDPETFRDTATFDDPTQYATGVVHLFVNGEPVIRDGEFLDARPGRALRLHTDGPADLIVIAGRIWTGDPDRPWAEAVAARDGEIVRVGSSEAIEPFRGPATRVIERPEGFATPGLIDAHGHVYSLGESLEAVDLRDVASLAEVQRLLVERAETLPDDAWILGRNWDQSLWPERAFPTAEVIDTVLPDHPVWLRRVDGHAAWANSEAMKRAGIDAATQAPSDGQIIRDANGDPTGVFIDGAMELIDRVVPAPSAETLRRRLLRAQHAAFAAGLTGVHDAGVSERMAEVYRELEAEGALTLRVYAMARPPEGREAAFVGRPPRSEDREGRFRLQAIKLFMDGAMGSRGALLFEPYADDPENLGLYLIEPETLLETTTAALKNGWQVATHAIGDKANALVIDAYAEARRRVPQVEDPRLRIEHAQVLRRSDVERCAAAGIVASMQPSHASTDMRWADARLGPERVLGAYAWRWFADANVSLAFGSDFPVEIADPTWGLYAAVTRKNAQGEPVGGWHPEHLLTLHEALRGFTSGAAFASFDEQRLGRLRPGFRADLTLFERDPFRSEAEALLELGVLATIVDGAVVYERPAR